MIIENFSDFINLKESLNSSIRRIEDSDDSCIIDVLDITDNNDLKKPRVILFDSLDDMAHISYINKAGEELGLLEIPMKFLKLDKNKNGKVSRVIFDKYKDKDLNSDSIDDFIEDFANYLTVKNGRNTECAKSDIDLVLDLLGIQGGVNDIERKDKHSWNAKLDNDFFVEMGKRSKDDLMGSFKIYKGEESSIPCIHIRHRDDSKNCIFSLNDEDPSSKIEEPIGFTELKSKNPYYSYLINRSMGKETKSHQSDFVDHFIDFLKNHSKDYKKSSDSNTRKAGEQKEESVKRMMKALSFFLPPQEIEDIYFKNLN
jgi:hypothetical protein